MGDRPSPRTPTGKLSQLRLGRLIFDSSRDPDTDKPRQARYQVGKDAPPRNVQRAAFRKRRKELAKLERQHQANPQPAQPTEPPALGARILEAERAK